MIDLNANAGRYWYASNGVYREPERDISDHVNGYIDSSLAAQAAAQGPRTYLGGSGLGHPCLRYLFYQWRGVPSQEPSGRMRRIWARGHAAEARMIKQLRGAGFMVVDRDKGGNQLEVTQAGGKIAMHVDGVITAGPVDKAIIPYPVLLELKCLNSASWSHLCRYGIEKSKEIYNAQIHIYMAYFRLEYCLFGAENANTCDVRWDLIKYDPNEAQRVSDRGVTVVSSEGKPLPKRIARNPDYYICRMCDRYKHCWGTPE